MSDPYLRVVATPTGTHVLFAARVQHWPFDAMSRHLWTPWGSDRLTDPQSQLFERQVRFITALHPGWTPDHQHRADTFTLDLRYISRPGAAFVDCVLMGKVFEADPEKARQAALELFERLSVVLPPGYGLLPAAEGDFVEWTGEDLAREDQDAELPWVEIRRSAELLFWTARGIPARRLPVVYPFALNPSGWESVWLAQARLGRPSLVSGSLSPAFFALNDEAVLADLAADFNAVAAEAQVAVPPHAPPEHAGQAGTPLSVQAAQFGALYTDYLAALRIPFSMRVVVRGPRAVALAVRTALSGPAWPPDETKFPLAVLAEMVEPGAEHAHTVRHNFQRLEQAHWDPYAPVVPLAPLLERLPYLVGPTGALSAFRLPLLPADGLPGVRVGMEFKPPAVTSAAPALKVAPAAAPA